MTLRARLVPPALIAAAVVAALALGAAVAFAPLVTGLLATAAAAVAILLAGPVVGTVAFIVAQPVLALPELGPTEEISKAAGAVVAVTVLAGLTVPQERARAARSLSALRVPALAVLALAAWGGVSALWARDVARYEADGVRWAFNLVLLAIVVLVAARGMGALRAVAGALVASATIAAVLGVVFGTAGGEGEIARLSSTLGDANELAALLAGGAILGFGLALSASSRTEAWAWAGCACACLLGIAGTVSRGGLIALAVGLLVWVLIAGRDRRRAAAILAAVVVTGGAFATFAASDAYTERFETLVTGSEVSASGEGTGRADIWRVGSEVLRDNPVAGVGLGNYVAVVPSYLDESPLVRRTDLILVDTKVAHSTPLHVAVELGVIGLLAFLAVVVLALAAAARATRLLVREGMAREATVVRASVAALIAVLAALAFISGQFERSLWILVGLAAASLPAAIETVRVRAATSREDGRPR
jgi:O-antigen ligase